MRTHWGLYVVWAILSITGLYFAYIQDWQMQEPTEWTVNILKLHGISAAFMLLFVGSLLSLHVRLSLNRKRNMISGLMILSCMFILIFSGIGLYYIPEDWHENMIWVHIWLGIICFLLLPAHIFIGYFLRKKMPKKKISTIIYNIFREINFYTTSNIVSYVNNILFA